VKFNTILPLPPHAVGFEDEPMAIVGVGFTVIVPVAFTVPQPPVKGIE
jgi:hypothetical protein